MSRFIKSFYFAFRGFSYAFKTQLNFKIHGIAALFVIGMGIYHDVNNTDWLWLFLCITLMLVLELINTALEVLVDLVCPGFNEKAGAIKDIAAAAVLITALFSLAVAIVIFYPKFVTDAS